MAPLSDFALAVMQRLGEEIRELERLGLHAHATGIKTAVRLLIQELEKRRETE